MGYQDDIVQYCLNPSEGYLRLGLVGEIGELAEKVRRAGQDLSCLVRDASVALELGDICWYAFMLANSRGQRVSLNVTLVACEPREIPLLIEAAVREVVEIYDGSSVDGLIARIYFITNALGYTLKEIFDMNLEKLASRDH